MKNYIYKFKNVFYIYDVHYPLIFSFIHSFICMLMIHNFSYC